MMLALSEMYVWASTCLPERLPYNQARTQHLATQLAETRPPGTLRQSAMRDMEGVRQHVSSHPQVACPQVPWAWLPSQAGVNAPHPLEDVN